ncbi:hypothetical protein A3K63_05405 [Candidatus Micrarchaeota archaeon RBG_16_49_10]|nr:MAG: hypothetical protein A3K63_05405 [Candidatus Micrarchaeota archaeon RBG_16_49_10]
MGYFRIFVPEGVDRRLLFEYFQTVAGINSAVVYRDPIIAVSPASYTKGSGEPGTCLQRVLTMIGGTEIYIFHPQITDLGEMRATMYGINRCLEVYGADPILASRILGVGPRQ